MSETPAPTRIGPDAYQSWRESSLGAITEAIEQRLILELMGRVEGADVLDAGCGDGVLTCILASRAAVVTGIDADPAMLAAAHTRTERAGVKATFLQGRIERLPFPDASFDTVAAITVLCFAADAAAAVREMARVLRPGGRLVLGELGRWSVWAMSRRGSGPGSERRLGPPRASAPPGSCMPSSSRQGLASQPSAAPSSIRRSACVRGSWHHSTRGWDIARPLAPRSSRSARPRFRWQPAPSLQPRAKIRTAFPIRAVAGETFGNRIIVANQGTFTVQVSALRTPAHPAGVAPIALVYAAQQDN